jgi:putative ABC transport system substrate-binding protein
VLSGGNRTANQVRFAAFEAGLRELGYTIGKTVHLDYRFADGEFSRLPSLAAEILRRKPDVLLAHTTPGSLAAKKATTNIPVVFVGVADPVGVGLVSNLSRPESNITGITNITAELAGKRLELLKEVVPQARQIAVFVNPNDANAQLQLHNVEAAARTIGISLGPVVHIRSVSDVSVAFEAAVKAGAQAGIRMVDPLSVVTRKPAADLALKYKLPVVFAFSQDVEAGGLLAYGPDIIEQFHRASTYIDKILKGAKPAELPIEQPMTFELAVNLKTARALGLTIPPEIMVRATRIIQ